VQRSPGGWDDIAGTLASFALSFPLAGVGAIVGAVCGNPVLGASLAVVGGSALGALIAGHEVWGGSRPGANPPVRWAMVRSVLVPTGLTLAGAGVGALLAGPLGAAAAGAVATGAVVGVGLPWLWLVSQLVKARFEPAPPPPDGLPTHPDSLLPPPGARGI
jgi:hypothetical protein